MANTVTTFAAGLQNSVQTSYANNGSTTILGRASQKTLNGQLVIGPALTQFIDVETLCGFTPQYSYYNPITNHMFVRGPAANSPVVALFNFNNTTGVYSYVGKINMNLGNAAATTYTADGFTVYESGGLIYILVSDSGSVVINGGTYCAWGLSTTDFTVGGTIIYPANTSSQKAVYFLQDPSALGVSHVATTPWGNALPQYSSNSAVNTKVWQFNGTLALPQLYSWDLSIAPTVAGTILNGVSAQTTLYSSTSPSAFFTMGASANGYSATNGDAVVLMNGTGNVPTAFTAWAAGTNQVAATNVYFIRDLQLVSGNYYFNLSSTTGGAAITPTSSTSSFTMMRAFGTSSSMFSLKTGVLSTAFGLGTILKSDSVGYCKPVSAPANTNLNGTDCLYMASTLGLYMGKISDLSSGGTTWASMTFAGVNMTGTGVDVVAPTAAFVAYSGQGHANDVDRFLISTAAAQYMIKPYQNSNISLSAAGNTNTWYETLNPQTISIGISAPSGVDTAGGWVFVCSTAIGQRGIAFGDLYSDQYFGNTSVISPVLSVPVGTVFSYFTALKQLGFLTTIFLGYIRSASTATDPLFSSASGGWTLIPPFMSLTSLALGPYFQIMATFPIASATGVSPSQINDFIYSVVLPNSISTNWEGSVNNTTPNGGTPSYTSFRLTTAYSSSVPTMYFRAYDDNMNLVASANTASNPTSFQYTTNNGTSWNSLGTIPNTILTTELRYIWATPPGVNVTSSLRES